MGQEYPGFEGGNDYDSHGNDKVGIVVEVFANIVIKEKVSMNCPSC